MAFNALKHGISAKIAVVPGVERAQDWQAVREETVRDLNPVGFLEIALAEWVAYCVWRRRRVVAFETASIVAEQAEVESELARWDPEVPCDDDWGPWPTLNQLDARIQELDDMRWLLGRLWQMPSDEPLDTDDAVAILKTVAPAANVDWKDVTVPGVPTGVAPEKFEKWTVKQVRAAIMILGEKGARTPQGLVKAAQRLARSKRAAAQRCREKVEQALARHRRHLRQRHLLPDPDILERIQRYEAHLTRQAERAREELEAVQDRRRGNGAPLARIDIPGPPLGSVPHVGKPAAGDLGPDWRRRGSRSLTGGGPGADPARPSAGDGPAPAQ